MPWAVVLNRYGEVKVYLYDVLEEAERYALHVSDTRGRVSAVVVQTRSGPRPPRNWSSGLRE